MARSRKSGSALKGIIMRIEALFSRKSSLILALVAGALLTWDVPVEAQYTTASLSGTVVDQTGAAAPDATVTAQNEDTGLSKAVTSQPDGTFLFPALPVG